MLVLFLVSDNNLESLVMLSYLYLTCFPAFVLPQFNIQSLDMLKWAISNH